MLAALCLCTGSAAAAGPHAGASVVGGHDATIAELPWMAAVGFGDEIDGVGCTGSVVAPRLVLTAAHCVLDLRALFVERPADLFVLTGVANLERARAGDRSAVERVLLYPHLNPDLLRGDAALLILAEPVGAAPIALAGPADADLYLPHTPARVAGWGFTASFTGEMSARLQVAPTNLQGTGYCGRRFDTFVYPYSSAAQVCAIREPEPTTTPCYGDSGGPLFATRADGTPVQVGITSFGEFGCLPRFAGIFTRVGAISAWVASWIAAVEAGAPEPAVWVPDPRLGLWEAKLYAGLLLRREFRRSFPRAPNRHGSCRRIDSAKAKCRVGWGLGRYAYWGNVTIYLAYVHQKGEVRAHYRIHWISRNCRATHRSPRACPIQTRRR